MTRAGRARRIATAAAYGGGGLGVLGAVGAAALYGLIKGEARLARRRIPEADDFGFPDVNGTTWAAQGVSASENPIRLAILGDSTAAGYGVHRDRDTPGVRMAIGISAAAEHPVSLTSVAAVGADSPMLADQLARVLTQTDALDLAVIIIGANDVTHRIRPSTSVRALRDTVEALRANGAEVVVATCPDLGTIRPIAQPLRYFARRLSRSLAAAQTIAVVEAGGRTVSLGDLLGPLFAVRAELFSDDQFHPSEAGYAAAADAILPSCLDALGLRTNERSASAFTTKRAKPVAKAAAQAAAHPGTEVTASEVAGHPSGRRGPWAILLKRRPPRSVETAAELARPIDPPNET
jgi:lysophospholipase L1-like esterase